MKKGLRFIANLICGCICALGAGLWFTDAFEVLFIEEKKD